MEPAHLQLPEAGSCSSRAASSYAGLKELLSRLAGWTCSLFPTSCVLHWSNTLLNCAFCYKKMPLLLDPPSFCMAGAQETAEEETLEMSALPLPFMFIFPSRAIFKHFKHLVFLFVLHQFGYLPSFFPLSPYFLVASICWGYFIYFGRMFCGVGVFGRDVLFPSSLGDLFCYCWLWLCSVLFVGLLFIYLLRQGLLL